MKRTVFERYGGFAKVSKLVLNFYDKMLDSPLTAPYFTNIDMKRLIDHQTKFFASLMGGPASYTNEHIERVHAHLGITEEAFFEAVEMLRDTLEDFNMDDEDIEHVSDEFLSRKNYIVTRS